MWCLFPLAPPLEDSNNNNKTKKNLSTSLGKWKETSLCNLELLLCALYISKWLSIRLSRETTFANTCQTRVRPCLASGDWSSRPASVLACALSQTGTHFQNIQTSVCDETRCDGLWTHFALSKHSVSPFAIREDQLTGSLHSRLGTALSRSNFQSRCPVRFSPSDEFQNFQDRVGLLNVPTTKHAVCQYSTTPPVFAQTLCSPSLNWPNRLGLFGKIALALAKRRGQRRPSRAPRA